jgi:hypothetical protein
MALLEERAILSRKVGERDEIISREPFPGHGGRAM